MSRVLVEADFEWAANELGCEIAAVKAVAEVESRGSGYLPDGRLTILFERHVFHRLTRGRFSTPANASISSPTPGGYVGGAAEWKRLAAARSLNASAAKLSASYGAFQTMGFNFAACGFLSVDEMVDAYAGSARGQLEGFVRFVQTNRLDDELRRKDWAGFARGYNGPNFKSNRYDQKMRDAYARHRGALAKGSNGQPD